MELGINVDLGIPSPWGRISFITMLSWEAACQKNLLLFERYLEQGATKIAHMERLNHGQRVNGVETNPYMMIQMLDIGFSASRGFHNMG